MRNVCYRVEVNEKRAYRSCLLCILLVLVCLTTFFNVVTIQDDK